MVWLDYSATRRELVGLLREHALALRETVAAAARSNRAAGALAEVQITERLRDQARALAHLDGAGQLTREAVEDVMRSNPLFRVSVFAADGTSRSARRTRLRGPRGRPAPGAREPVRVGGWGAVGAAGAVNRTAEAAAGAGVSCGRSWRGRRTRSSPGSTPRAGVGRTHRSRGEARRGRSHRRQRRRHRGRRAAAAGLAGGAARGDHGASPEIAYTEFTHAGGAARLRRRPGREARAAADLGRARGGRRGTSGPRVHERGAHRGGRGRRAAPRHAPRRRAAGRAAHGAPPAGRPPRGGDAGGPRLRSHRAAPALRGV